MSARLQAPQSKPGLPAHVLRKATVTFAPTSTFTSTSGGNSGQTDAADRAAQISLVHQRRQARESQVIAESRRITNSTRGTYTGAELKPYQGRPGSLNFLALPSLIGLRRVFRKDQS